MTSGRNISEAMIAEIRRLRLGGMTIREIARVTGVTKNTVAKYTKFSEIGFQNGTASEYHTPHERESPRES